MFEYLNNEQLQDEIKATMRNFGITYSDLAREFGITPQSINDLMKKKNFAFKDLQRICEVMDCKLIIDIVPNNK